MTSYFLPMQLWLALELRFHFEYEFKWNIFIIFVYIYLPYFSRIGSNSPASKLASLFAGPAAQIQNKELISRKKLMNKARKLSRISSSNLTELSLLPIPDDTNPRWGFLSSFFGGPWSEPPFKTLWLRGTKSPKCVRLREIKLYGKTEFCLISLKRYCTLCLF